jgi:CDP-diacylglycerol pyrophosphatase
MSFDYSKLSGKIREMYGTQSNFAKALDMSERSLSLKLGGKRSWTQDEMDRAISCLKLNAQDIPDYFFKKKVQKIEQNIAAAG